MVAQCSGVHSFNFPSEVAATANRAMTTAGREESVEAMRASSGQRTNVFTTIQLRVMRCELDAEMLAGRAIAALPAIEATELATHMLFRLYNTQKEKKKRRKMKHSGDNERERHHRSNVCTTTATIHEKNTSTRQDTTHTHATHPQPHTKRRRPIFGLRVKNFREAMSHMGAPLSRARTL